MAQVQSDGNCPDWSDWLKRPTSGSESQGAPSFNSLPGIQSGPQALEGSMRLRREDKCGSVGQNFRRLSVYHSFMKVPNRLFERPFWVNTSYDKFAYPMWFSGILYLGQTDSSFLL